MPTPEPASPASPPPTPESTPPPDKDGDGVADGEDTCPDAKGPAATRGCPDQDGDGVADADDRCPRGFGLPAAKGCLPRKVRKLLTGALRGARFRKQSAKLPRKGKARARKVAAALAKHPELGLTVVGYAKARKDPKGAEALAVKRAEAVRDALVAAGVAAERLSVRGRVLVKGGPKPPRGVGKRSHVALEVGPLAKP